MRKLIILSVVLTAVFSAFAFTGDLRVIYIQRYDEPGWKPGNLLFTDEQTQKLEMELPLDKSFQLPESFKKCEGLMFIYGNLLEEGGGKVIARRFAAMNQGDLFVYLIDDREGLTPIMIDYAGICEYTDAADGKRYAWLCGQCDDERAIKIGEHYFQQFLKQTEKMELDWGPFVSGNALLGFLLAEMTSTIVAGGWQPNDVVMNPGIVTTHSLGRPARDRGSAETGGFKYELTVMSTDNACEIRGFQNYIVMFASTAMLEIFHKFYDNQGIFKAWKESETATNLGATPEFPTLTDKHIGYFWKSIPPERLFRNEVFCSLFSYYFAATQPPIVGADGKKKIGLEQLLDHFAQNQETGLTLAEIISVLMENYKKSGVRDDPKLRQLYAIGLMDILSRFKASRVVFEGFLSSSVKAGEAADLLDSYLGTARVEGLRDDLRRKTVGMDLEQMEKHLRDRLVQKDYLTGSDN